jgi:hypothetical protein
MHYYSYDSNYIRVSLNHLQGLMMISNCILHNLHADMKLFYEL